MSKRIFCFGLYGILAATLCASTGSSSEMHAPEPAEQQFISNTPISIFSNLAC